MLNELSADEEALIEELFENMELTERPSEPEESGGYLGARTIELRNSIIEVDLTFMDGLVFDIEFMKDGIKWHASFVWGGTIPPSHTRVAQSEVMEVQGATWAASASEVDA